MSRSAGPIRIAFCHHTSDVGGGSDRSLFDLVTHLPRDRFESLAILRTGDPLADEYRKAGIAVETIDFLPPRKTRDWRVHARFAARFGPNVWQTARAIRRFRADLVHVNTMTNLQGAVAARLVGRPLVWHVREINTDSRAGRAIVRLIRLLATRVVAISSAVAETVRDCGERVAVVPNGIDLEEYRAPVLREAARRELGMPEDVPLAVALGRLEPWKGQHVFVEAVPRILAAHPEARFWVVGGPAVNKPEYAPQLRRRCEELGVAARVEFTGPRRDVPAILAACDVLVLPSATPEPFGRTVVEAMAAGRPVVATAAGGPLETVVEGETGLLVPAEDPAALADAVSALFGDPARARAMGEAGRRRAFERYALERLVGDMAGVFEEVCGRRGG